MKKKLIALLAAAMMVVFGMASMAFAASSCECPGDPCSCYCAKWTAGNIPIEDCSGGTQQQAAVRPTAFDFEGALGTIWPGYCAGTHSFETLIYSICCCDTEALNKLDPTAGATIRFVVEILTDGVYFGDENISQDKANAVVNALRDTPYARFQQYAELNNAADSLCVSATGGTIWGIDPTGDMPYVIMEAEQYVSDNEALDDNTGPAQNMWPILADGTFECIDGSTRVSNKIQYSRDFADGTRLTTDKLWERQGAGFNIESSFLAFDLPTFVYDNGVVKANTQVQVKITIQIFERDCPVCAGTWEDICSCTKVVGTFVESCGVAASTEKCFPYVAGTNNDEKPWWTGVAISNMSDEAQTYTVAVTIEGKTATFEQPVAANSVETFTLEGVKDKLGDLDITQNGYIQVSCENGHFDGFAMVGDQTQAMGYLPRCGACGTCND